jgi:hypothetical protein
MAVEGIGYMLRVQGYKGHPEAKKDSGGWCTLVNEPPGQITSPIMMTPAFPQKRNYLYKAHKHYLQ